MAETDTMVHITCTDDRTGVAPESRVSFWKINEALYGLLQVPKEYKLSFLRLQQELVIPTIRRDMNGSIFQCVRIDYQNNIMVQYGRTVRLIIRSIPFEFNSKYVHS